MLMVCLREPALPDPQSAGPGLGHLPLLSPFVLRTHLAPLLPAVSLLVLVVPPPDLGYTVWS